MIFNVADHIEQIKAGTKTQTRRSSDRYQEDKLYAVQPGRGKKGIPEGKIFINFKIREYKPDLGDLPEDAVFERRWREADAGYPIRDWSAEAEGGYTVDEYEALYEAMHPGWTERWCYHFTYFTVEELIECGAVKPKKETLSDD